MRHFHNLENRDFISDVESQKDIPPENQMQLNQWWIRFEKWFVDFSCGNSHVRGILWPHHRPYNCSLHGVPQHWILPLATLKISIVHKRSLLILPRPLSLQPKRFSHLQSSHGTHHASRGNFGFCSVQTNPNLRIYTHTWTFNMDTKNAGMEHLTPFKCGVFGYPCSNSGIYVCLFWDFEVEMLLLLRHESYAGHCRLIHEAPPKCCPRNAPNASSNLITTHYMHSKDQNMMYIWFCMYVISLSLWSISSASEPVWRPLVDQAQLPCDLETTGILLCQSTKRNIDPTTRPHPRKDSWSSNYHVVMSMSLWSMFWVSYTFSTQDSCHCVDSLGKGFT